MSGNIAYEDYQQMIDNDGGGISVAEVHGLMTGMLCMDPSASFGKWRSEMKTLGILAGQGKPEALECLIPLFDGTRDRFAADEFEFTPCLPDDEYPIDERVGALGEWCQGFLIGLGEAKANLSWPGQCHEIITDLIAISNVDPDSNRDDDENSLMELIEYVRVGVELIRMELRAAPDLRKIH